ncbi:TerC family protein [Rhizobium sp. CG4]|jgi:CBS domain containing-hemolysin-like protein|uniref:TerC family protein n=1 Tax=Rhizobium sp. CG4 TaxID=2726075 RepID=UPI0020335BC4|nr:TerC family protein [Rhizobium sp. CG4]MCM2457944.1 TerC family protein [Rhizobium sp. CG4]
MIFEWMSDPAAWAGLATLIVLEIVLGIDNLVFIAILADKLPEHQREKARLIGLSLALVMRLILLASIAWIVTLTAPLFTVAGMEISGRDLILIVGGVFLLFKGTMELHERLEGHTEHKEGKIHHAIFWQVLVQIVVLDAVFSLDSVITAVGMVKELSVMMIGVIVAMAVMMMASKPLMAFVSKHPTVVILCLGFLMMIGFSLVVEGLGFHIPKGYLYAAIGFSILIEAFNQVGRRNRERFMSTGDLRERTANAVLSLLGSRKSETSLGEAGDVIADRATENELFTPVEHDMIESVLALADRPAKSIMTPRRDVEWLDIDDSEDELRKQIIETGHSRFPIGRGSLDDFVGVAFAKDLLRDLLETGKIDFDRSLRQPLVVHESVSALRLLEQLRQSPLQVAIVLDEYGSMEGMVTPTDLLEAIAGEFLDDDEPFTLEREADDALLVDGRTDIRHVSKIVDADLVDDADRYSTLAGLILWRLGHLPRQGETVVFKGLVFEVVALDGRNINKVRIKKHLTELEITSLEA